MKRLAILAVVLIGTRDSARAEDPDTEKLFARCVDSAALVFGPEETKDPVAVAGALVLDRDKRLLLAPHANVSDAPTVVFPAYTAKGELRNKPTDYAEQWKKGERWKGKVLHRDKVRELTVIELDRALPDRARAAEFRSKSALLASTIYALNKKADGDKMWQLQKGDVSAILTGPPLSTGPSDFPKGPRRVFVTASRGTGPDCGLFDRASRVAGFASPPDARDSVVNGWLDVTEVRAFLTDMKVPFQTAPDDPKPKGPKSK